MPCGSADARVAEEAADGVLLVERLDGPAVGAARRLARGMPVRRATCESEKRGGDGDAGRDRASGAFERGTACVVAMRPRSERAQTGRQRPLTARKRLRVARV